MPTECSAERFDFGLVERREVVGSFEGGAITSDAGGRRIGRSDWLIGWPRAFTDYRTLGAHLGQLWKSGG
jgi:hypothetical protein